MKVVAGVLLMLAAWMLLARPDQRPVAYICGVVGILTVIVNLLALWAGERQ